MQDVISAFPRLNEPAPDFNAKTTHGDRKLADYKGKWLILFSHPADFTPVCTTEFIGFQKAADTFRSMNCELIGLSIDSLYSHLGWTPGCDVIVPPPKSPDAIKQRMGEGYKTTDWYFSTKSL